MESQTQSSKRAPRELQSWRVQGNPRSLCQPSANPPPTLRRPFADPLPTFSANLFSKPLFPWIETRVNGFLAVLIREIKSVNGKKAWTITHPYIGMHGKHLLTPHVCKETPQNPKAEKHVCNGSFMRTRQKQRGQSFPEAPAILFLRSILFLTRS